MPTLDEASGISEKEASILLSGGALRRLNVLARVFQAKTPNGEPTLAEFLDWCDRIDSQYNRPRQDFDGREGNGYQPLPYHGGPPNPPGDE